MTLTRYRENLRVEGDKVYSYDTHVATIQGNKLIVHGWWSMTTSKHVNYVAAECGLTVEKGEPAKDAEDVEKPDSGLRSIAMVAKLGDLMCPDRKGKNDWKLRMIKAGLEGRGLIMPEDWDTLSEEEKERRLNGAIDQLK